MSKLTHIKENILHKNKIFFLFKYEQIVNFSFLDPYFD